MSDERNKRVVGYLEQQHGAQMLPRLGDRYAITSGVETKVYEVSSMDKLDDEITIGLSLVSEDARLVDENHPSARDFRQIVRKVDQD